MSAQPTVPAAAPDLRERTRARALQFGDAVTFSGSVLRGVGAATRRYLVEVLRQSTILARGSVLIVIALVFAFGLVVGIQSSYGARLVGAPSISALGPALGSLRELTPYAFAYMMAAKVSTGYVAEIGTMRITEEIDALDVMGIESKVYLCTTRVLATWLILPFMYGIAVLVGFIASYLAIVVQIGQVSAGGYLELFWKFQSPTDFLFSGLKGMLMGTYVVLVGVYYGYRVRGGPVEVGVATARAMIVNLVGIHLIGVLTSEVFWGGQAHLPIGG
jgi:phospholipid/cholesterol/gamma-HCH transport system permease protein